MKIISVSNLNGYIKEKLDSDFLLSNVWVRGEISNFKHHSSGHMYFTLKDKTGAVKAVMFRSRNNSLFFEPKEGMAVIAKGYVSVYERDGMYQLYVEEMHQQGVGTLHVAYLQLKEKLEKEGLFDPQRKRPLPRFPQRIGVVTSQTGAAVRDIVTVIHRRYPQAHIILFPVAVQGDEAPGQICEGIRLANEMTNLDVLIVGRGGGSIEELWAFNTEVVARSIFASTVPVVSAVGHETDFTIADFVADMRAPTPSAAAEIVVPDFREIQKNIDMLEQRMILGLKNLIYTSREKLNSLTGSPVMKRPQDKIYRMMQDLDQVTRRMAQAAKLNLTGKKSCLALQVSRLDDLSPLATMKRGYSICRDPGGRVVNSVNGVRPGDTVEVIVTDGSADCVVKNIKEGAYGRR
ncbi:exodeoxyribonuclease VII large subunit [Phosphitispora fastidiosa]|uniref:exodeoxyribonuclease VII large subunit n=1 Tax=Phosphitispora fastidiosa TaxID=2837202 RepID=UPI001E61F53C|nr:exodeoxyribonuclease VII large subunit [Phosphitispora fastidiosa]